MFKLRDKGHLLNVRVLESKPTFSPLYTKFSDYGIIRLLQVIMLAIVFEVKVTVSQ